jgi:hypothetical protein
MNIQIRIDPELCLRIVMVLTAAAAFLLRS